MSPVAQMEMPAANTIRYAGFWRRFVAALIDGLLIGAVFTVIGLAIGLNFNAGKRYGPETGQAAAAGFMFFWFIEAAVGWLYCAWMESSSSQATLGKMALGVRVTDMDGKRISFGRATGRYFAKFLSAIVLMIGYLMAAFTPRKQAMHDMIAGTLVLSKQAAVPVQVAQNAFAQS